MVKVTKIVEKSLKPEDGVGEEPSSQGKKSRKSSQNKKNSNPSSGLEKDKGALLSKLGPYEEKKKVEKMEFSDKLGELFGVDPSETDEKS
jgi:hypothetical protein